MKLSTFLPRHATIFYYTIRAKEIRPTIPDDSSPKHFDPLMVEFKLLTIGILNDYIPLLPLILKTYKLKDKGKIYWIDNVLEEAVRKMYREMVVKPNPVFNMKAFNHKLLKPEYIILFDFVQKVFMAFSGTHESITLPKFKCITTVVQKLNVNWARVLVSLLLEEATQLSKVTDKGRVFPIKQERPIRHGCKVSVLLHNLMPSHMWSQNVEISSSHVLPHSDNQM